MVRGPKKHLKRLAAPKSWMLDKLGGVYTVRPSSGPHKGRESMPLTLFLRNRLKYALNKKEVQTILKQRLVKIDGKVRTDPKYPAGLIFGIKALPLCCMTSWAVYLRLFFTHIDGDKLYQSGLEKCARLCHKFRSCTNPMTHLHLCIQKRLRNLASAPLDLDHCNVVIPCGNFVLLEHPGLISSMYQGSNFRLFTVHSGIDLE